MTLDIQRETPVDKLQALIGNVEQVIFGKPEAVSLAVIGLLAEGHILLEDVPGTGKTSLARAVARSVDLDFRRVQLTSDLLPADLLGVSVYSNREESFVFQPGPIFGNVVLADELNRTTPRTQSALLECMDERQVSVDGETRELPRPFIVIATQNPLEFEGTYPLPESQLDRFLMRIRIGYPARDDERRILLSRLESDPIDELEAVMTRDELITAIEAARRVRVDEALLEYVLEVTEETRRASTFLLGASPRAGLGWLRCAQASALLEDRGFCIPDDLKRTAVATLAHRVVPVSAGGGEDGIDVAADEAIAQLLDSIPVPE